MIDPGRLLMVPVILHAGTIITAALLARSPNLRRAAASTAILRRQFILSLVFFGLCLRWKEIADAPLVLFASLFVLASATHAVLTVRGDDVMAVHAIRAGIVALAGLAALLLMAMAPD